MTRKSLNNFIFRRIYALMAFGPLSLMMWAERPLENIETNDGSVYMGHTVQQIFNGRNSSTIFLSDSSVRILPVEAIEDLLLDQKNYETGVYGAWKEWFESHPNYVNKEEDGEKTVTIYTINPKEGNKTFKGFLLERSPKHYKFFVADFLRDTIPDRNIKKIEYATREPNAVNGIVDEVVTINGDHYIGQIVSWTDEYTGLLTDSGIIELIPNNLIAQKKIEALNPSAPLIEQVKYLDEVEGNYKISGIITNRNRRPFDDSAPYYMIYNESSDSDELMEMKDVRTIKKKKNEKYVPLEKTEVFEDSSY